MEASLQYAELKGWLVEKSNGQAHCWGKYIAQ